MATLRHALLAEKSVNEDGALKSIINIVPDNGVMPWATVPYAGRLSLVFWLNGTAGETVTFSVAMGDDHPDADARVLFEGKLPVSATGPVPVLVAVPVSMPSARLHFLSLWLGDERVWVQAMSAGMVLPAGTGTIQ